MGFKLVILGGISCDQTNMPEHPYVFNPRTNEWSKKDTPLPYGKIYESGCSTLYLKDGKHILMMAGGRNENHEIVGNVAYLELENEDGEWVQAPDIVPMANMPHLAYLGK